jgi:hypothetical protein
LVEIAIPECMKKIRDGIDVEKCNEYIFLVFTCFLRVAGGADLDMKTMRLVISKDSERELTKVFNESLSKLGYPLIEANADGFFTYPYSTAKEATRKFVDMLGLKDCSGLFFPDACKRYNESLTATIICSNPPLVATAKPVQQVATDVAQPVQQVATAQTIQAVAKPIQEVATAVNQPIQQLATAVDQPIQQRATAQQVATATAQQVATLKQSNTLTTRVREV